jgi:alpha-D-ribose 1-methylphosphonate 5-phosphate C-P lyase
MADTLYLFCAGREKRIYAIPPHTYVEGIGFEDHPFRIEDFSGKSCAACGSEGTYLNEIIDDETGSRTYQCSDTSWCRKVSRGAVK